MSTRAAAHSLLALSFTALLFCGIVVRAVDLGTHFAHIDDIGVARTIFAFKYAEPLRLTEIAQEIREETQGRPARALAWLLDRADRTPLSGPAASAMNGLFKFMSVPASWTYAPLQFVFTNLLIHEGQSYRQVLFWGRFPSLLFGILGLLAFLWLYAECERLETPAGMIALALAAFSWENIIYAKQMSSYAVGVFAAVCVMAWLVRVIRRADYSRRVWLTSAALLALLCHAQYQILFMVPAFFLTLTAAGLSDLRTKKRRLLADTFLAIAVFGFLIFPVWAVFLRRYAARGVTELSAGPHGEFALQLDAARPWMENLSWSLVFFLKNSWIVLTNNLAFLPYDHPLFIPMAIFFAIFAAGGAWALFRSSYFRKRMLLFFLSAFCATWAAMTLCHRLTLGPTRHSLVLLPAGAVLVAEGISSFSRLLRRPAAAVYAGPFVALTLAAMFFGSFDRIVKERQDPFDEAALTRLVVDQDIDTVIESEWFLNMRFMRGVTDRTHFLSRYSKHDVRDFRFRPGLPLYRNILIIGHDTVLTPETFERYRAEVNAHPDVLRDPSLKWDASWKDYVLTERREISSNVEVEFSPLATPNFANGCHYYVLKRKTAV